MKKMFSHPKELYHSQIHYSKIGLNIDFCFEILTESFFDSQHFDTPVLPYEFVCRLRKRRKQLQDDRLSTQALFIYRFSAKNGKRRKFESWKRSTWNYELCKLYFQNFSILHVRPGRVQTALYLSWGPCLYHPTEFSKY